MSEAAAIEAEEREAMEYDVVIVGAGPTGLAAEIGRASCRERV